ncbi:hypothetical protein FGO68_gene6961 [Halteria grandinella]|uniref:Poly(A) RNA polymerase mitochondrial-like central palm domain-containing protein n=1 Tax=Halteria grandinella TaxID=5974 RepID=A0A8J8NSZ0_HALGN|nr:hypothetical protein FGO68_gene6961 [Halteria grandinella]
MLNFLCKPLILDKNPTKQIVQNPLNIHPSQIQVPIKQELNQQISQEYMSLMQSNEERRNVTASFLKLRECLKHIYGLLKIDLIPYGSFVSGLALTGKGMSDLDVTLLFQDAADMIKKRHAWSVEDFKSADIHNLQIVQKGLQEMKNGCQPEKNISITAFGAILEIKDTQYGVNIELQINKVLDPYNSKLIQTYSMFDHRFHQLALILKNWNKKHFPLNTTRINSYSITLMLIAYLQKKNVLPYLQSMRSEKKEVSYVKYVLKGGEYQFGYTMKANVAFEDNLSIVDREFKDRDRKSSVDQLLIGFFEFHLERFDSEEHAIRINKKQNYVERKRKPGAQKSQYEEIITKKLQKYRDLKQKMLKESANWTLVLIDPFDIGYNPCKGVQEPVWSKYLQKFRQSLKALKEESNLQGIFR